MSVMKLWTGPTLRSLFWEESGNKASVTTFAEHKNGQTRNGITTVFSQHSKQLHHWLEMGKGGGVNGLRDGRGEGRVILINTK